MHTPRRPLPSVLLTVVAALSGCGGSGPAPDPVPRAAAASERDQYIAQADAFCMAANEAATQQNERIMRIVERAQTADKALAAIAPLLEAAYEKRRELYGDFRSIEPPTPDRETIEELWAAYDARNVMLRRLAGAARSRDAARFKSLVAEQQRASARSDVLARGYGFRECGSGKGDRRVAASEAGSRS